MPTYKTPDVYVEEISVFPPSVAEVETAIPAFIGYTEKAILVAAGDLLLVPTRVKSLLEFETYFGGAKKITLTNVAISEANDFVSATFTNVYYLYDSIRSFFDNGGGPCYIVSVGSYSDAPASAGLINGINAVKKFDEPTMLVFPDAAGLAANSLGAVQQQALTQCASLKDRVTICDTRSDDTLGTNFRTNIGINNLKYGAAYTPWLKVSYEKNVTYNDIKSVITKSAVATTLSSLTTDTGITGTIANLDFAITDAALVASNLTSYITPQTTINARFNALLATYQSAKTVANLQAVYTFVYNLASYIDDLQGGSGVHGAFKTLIQNMITNTLLSTYTSLISNEIQLAPLVTGWTAPLKYTIDPDPAATQWLGLWTSTPAASAVNVVGAATDADKMDRFVPYLTQYFSAVNGQIDGIVAAAQSYLTTYDQTLYDIFPAYKNIITGINNTAAAIPPSGTMAGIYAMVDNQRGVWKAPANVSLANVIAPTVNFDTVDTDGLNVDTNAGKSINAIRAFAGKGTLVWGARTLAGNDNEWRYISVRRFFNMVEESVKKSTYWAVFEPNDANTWVKVRGMIENYLTQKWREGALAGASTKEAFFVRCSLGTTMTSQDILEGRMNVEIGMAVVRPAEFIVLKFSHKLQTS